MNLISVFAALLQMGICQPMVLHDSHGKELRAFVCPADPIMNEGDDDPDTAPPKKGRVDG